MYKKIGLIVLALIFDSSVKAQIAVNDSEDLISVVKKLEGSGVQISNITYHFSSGGKRPAGAFSDDYGIIGLDKGLLLTTGAAVNAIGPNHLPNKSQSNSDSLQDPDLMPYIEDYGSVQMHDVCYVEFDLVSAYPILSFDYIFASEEYTEFLNYHDVFVFLISGPGITGKKNIALVPNTNVPVSVASINPLQNSQYYISNGSGATPWINIDLQYDGYTRILNATSNVIPCETYHIKLAIVDVVDNLYDSGVFIEEGSFTSNNINMKVQLEHPRFNTAIEGCNDAYVIFKRPFFSDKSEEIEYNFLIKGSAGNGSDYSLIADSIVIPAGMDSAFITISPFLDGISDDNEYVRLVLNSTCSVFPDFDSIDVPIRESFLYFIPAEKICLGQSVTLNKTFIPGDSIFWDASPYLSCIQCPSPVAANPPTIYFPYTAKDTASGCVARDSVNVEAIQVKADFSFYQDPCYTSLDFFFVNNSQNASNYFWDFGDSRTSDQANLLHQFPFFNKQDATQYNVTLVASLDQPSCSDDTTVTLHIANPLFIPNLITGNKDAKNDEFKIVGIDTGCWKLWVYNRWGNLVYKNEDYKNNFTGEDLKSGAYFYTIQNRPEDREFKGWIHIIND